MTNNEAKKMVETAKRIEALMLNDMGPDEYKTYMAMPQDHRFMIVCAQMAVALA